MFGFFLSSSLSTYHFIRLSHVAMEASIEADLKDAFSDAGTPALPETNQPVVPPAAPSTRSKGKRKTIPSTPWERINESDL